MYEYKPIIRDKIYVGVLLLFILAIISFIIIPDYFNLKNFDQDIQKLTQTQEIQQKFRPLYNKISLKADMEKLSGLQVPQNGWFNRSEIGNISEIFKDLAEKNGLECLQSGPEVDSLYGESKTMLINIVLEGKFKKFRNFLLDMTNLNYLDSIEEIKIISKQTGKKYFLKIWISIK